MRLLRCATYASLLVVAPPLAAQGGTWRFIASPAAGLWFHGLALSGAGGFGAFPLYDPQYRLVLTGARTRAQTPISPLEAAPPPLAASLAADSALEVLHFVPLWFPASTPTEMLDALADAAATPRHALAVSGSREQYGVRLVLAALPGPAPRAELGRYVASLRAELAAGYPAVQRVLLPPERAAEVAEAWGPLAAALAPYLEAHGLAGGTVLLVPSLGPDGRFFLGLPRDPRDNVAAVRLGPDEPVEAALYRLVRELCYPLVRDAMSGTAEPADRIAGERVSGVAAVRCGHELLARYAPDRVAAYDALWLREVVPTAAFETGYPLPAELATAITRRISAP